MAKTMASRHGTTAAASAAAAAARSTDLSAMMSNRGGGRSSSGMAGRAGDPHLSPEQLRGLELALQGRSLFFTGSAGAGGWLPPVETTALVHSWGSFLWCCVVGFGAHTGTGKSLLLREMVRVMRQAHGNHAVYVTASTGLAACNIGGCTVRCPPPFAPAWLHDDQPSVLSRGAFRLQLHSFAGVGLAEQDQQALLAKVLANQRSRKRWQSAKVLIVDEVVAPPSPPLSCCPWPFEKKNKNKNKNKKQRKKMHLLIGANVCFFQSMLEGTLFDKLDFIGRKVRKNDAPFGGIQLILSGDFLQASSFLAAHVFLFLWPHSRIHSTLPASAATSSANQDFLFRFWGVEEGHPGSYYPW